MKRILADLCTIADKLDKLGHAKYSDAIDGLIMRIAQESTEGGSKNALAEAVLMVLERYKEKFESALSAPGFSYLGEENVLILRNGINELTNGINSIIEPSGDPLVREHSNKLINTLQTYYYPKIDRAKNVSSLENTKIIVDKTALFGPLDLLYKAFERAAEEDTSLKNILQNFKNFKTVYSQIIQNTSEQIADVDLTENQ